MAHEVALEKIATPFASLMPVVTNESSYCILQESIRHNGILVPLLVQRTPIDENGHEYLLIDGHLRYYIACMLHLKVVPVCEDTAQDLSPGAVVKALRSYASDVKKHDASDLLIEYIHSDEQATETDILRVFNLDRDWLEEVLGFDALCPVLLTSLREGDLPILRALYLQLLPQDMQFAVHVCGCSLCTTDYLAECLDLASDLSPTKATEV